MAYKCIDISYFQGLDNDFCKIKSCGVDAVIARAGEIYLNAITPDDTWITNATGANANNIHLGSYYTSGATSLEMAQQEVDFFISRLICFKIDMPCYIDLEFDVNGGDTTFLQQNADAVIQIYMDALEKAGYVGGVYANYNWFKDFIDEERWKDKALWIAQNPDMTYTPDYFGMWQYGTSQIDGAGEVDTNQLYIPYWDRSLPEIVPIVITPSQDTLSLLDIGVEYDVHVEGFGWLPTSRNGFLAGTEGKSLRVEAFRVRLIGVNGRDIHVAYKANIQDRGWTDLVYDGADCGTTGLFLRLEAISIVLTGADAALYSLEYRSHSQSIGTQDWAKDGELSGTEGAALRLESLAILIVLKGVDLGIGTFDAFKHFDPIKPEDIPVANIPPAVGGGLYGLYFDSYEFACDCIKGVGIDNPSCDGYPETQYGRDPNINPQILNVLNQARSDLNTPIVITCGTRCPVCNDFWGGVPNSNHLIGGACDCYCPGMDIVTFAFFLYNNYGISVRVYPNQGFAHIEFSDLGGVYNQEQYYYM